LDIPRRALRAGFLTLTVVFYLASCQGADEYFRDGGLQSTGGTGNTVGSAGSGGTSGPGVAGTGGGPLGTSGSSAGNGTAGAAGSIGGTGNTAGTGGSGGTGNTVGTGGRGGTTGGSAGGGSGTTGGSSAGRGGTTGGSAGGSSAGRGGTTGGSGGSSGGTTGANCVDAIKVNMYTATGAPPCSVCMENGMSREMLCQKMIDCLDATTPCSSPSANCWLSCRNSNGISGPTEKCVSDLVTASCM
jgi:hypothetical protein